MVFLEDPQLFQCGFFSKFALPSYYPVTLNFVKSHANKFYFSLHCLCTLMLQKIGTSVSCGSGVYDWFIIAAPLKSNSLRLLGKTDCQTVSLFSLALLVCPSTWVTVARNSRIPTRFTKGIGYLSLKDNLKPKYIITFMITAKCCLKNFSKIMQY